MIPSLEKIQGCLMGVMIGDAMGMSVEMMTAEEIKNQTGGITGFIKPLQKRVKDTMDLPAGTTTDDWALTKVVATSLIKCDGTFDLYDIALRHVAEYENSKFGWGRNTRTGIEQIKAYFDSRGMDGRRPGEWRTDSSGCGNGVAMKVSPLAIVGFDNRSYCYSIGSLTHGNIEASISAYGLSLCIGDILNKRKINVHDLCFGVTDVLNNEFDDRISILANEDLLFGPIEKLVDKVGTGCNALESVPFAIAIFLRNKNDFRKGILEAANAGGDTDSICSMAGALIGANVGIDEIPKEWINFSESFQEAIELGKNLHKMLQEKGNRI